MNEAQPCPFCSSSETNTILAAGDQCWIQCLYCAAQGPIADNQIEAIAKWNQAPRRASE